jgi:hypothetical protein
MLRLGPYFITLFVLIFILQILQQYIMVPTDLFLSGQQDRLKRLDRLSTSHHAAYKIRYVLNSKPHDVLVFGNSSALGVQSAYLKEFGQAFNLAVPGSSLRLVVGITDLLEREDRLPKTLVVMLENFDNHTQQVQHMPLRWRWRNSFDDIIAGLRSPMVSVQELAHMSTRLLKVEINRFLLSFNLNLLIQHINFLLQTGIYESKRDLVWKGYSRDGGGSDMRRPQLGRVKIHKRPVRTSVLKGYFKLDLERLARLKGKSRVIIYESPLEPNNMAHFANNPMLRTIRLRQLFLENCKRLELECYPAPILGKPGQPNYWIDHYHPPANLISPWVANLLRTKKREGGTKP